MKEGVISIGLKAPMIRQGDDLVKIVVDTVLGYTKNIKNKDVIGITESIVARAQGNYVTIDDIAQYLEEHNFSKVLNLYNPLMSRNRFSLILKGIARYADEITIWFNGETDDQGNPNYGINQFTGVDIQDYYTEICKAENCKLNFDDIHSGHFCQIELKDRKCYIDCSVRPDRDNYETTTLADILCRPVTRKDGTQSGCNSFWGVLGSNKADEELLKLFPKPIESTNLVYAIQREILDRTGKTVEVMVYGDGCFKDPVGGIWEFADPETSPAYTEGLEGLPNEIKIKYFADSKYKDLSGEELDKAIDKEIKLHKNKDLVGSMVSQGTTPRRYVDLLASLMDLTTGSGMRKTPIVLVRNYFD
jgi:hypothetical protein